MSTTFLQRLTAAAQTGRIDFQRLGYDHFWSAVAAGGDGGSALTEIASVVNCPPRLSLVAARSPGDERIAATATIEPRQDQLLLAFVGAALAGVALLRTAQLQAGISFTTKERLAEREANERA